MSSYICSFLPPAGINAAYVVVRTYYKDSGKKDAQADHPVAATVSTPSATAADKSPESAAAAPSKVFPPIPQDEQRQLYRWMLEEKRKVRPRDAAEKKKLDEEKALLKEIIRAESFPSL